MMLVKLLGIIGGVLFCLCGVPAAFKTIRAGKSLGTPVSIAWMIFLGSIFMYAYLTLTYGMDWIITMNYSVEALSWGILVFFHYKSIIKK